MSDIKVSQLASASTANASDTFMVIQDGVSKRVLLSTILNNLNSTSDVRINPTQTPINLIVSGYGDVNLLYINGTTAQGAVGIGTASPQEQLHINKNLKVGGIYRGSSETIGSASLITLGEVISLLHETSALELTGACTFTLGAGAEGQTKFITATYVAVPGTATIAVTNGAGFSNIMFDANVGRGVTLKYVNSRWHCVGNNGATFS